MVAKEVVKDDRFSKTRAEKAYFLGNDVAKAGAVTYLNSEEQKVLENWILAQKLTHKFASYRDVLIKVRVLL